MHSMTSYAGTPVALRESFAGNLSFAITGGSFLDGNNCGDNISTRTSSEIVSNIPTNSSIESAWLYWAGSYNPNSSSGVASPDNSVTLSSPTGSRNITASTMFTTSWGEDSNDTPDPDEAYFNGKADVTAFVTGNGTYSVSNLSVHTDSPQCEFSTIIAGWALVIVYEDDREPFRVVNIFDGFEYYYGKQLLLTPNNFNVSSNPSGKHAHITWEGDINNSDELRGFNESLKFEDQDLTDFNNPTNNQFNSYSNSLGKSTLGLDIDEYEIDASFIREGDTSATTLYSSGEDMVFLTAEVISISNVPVADLSVSATTDTTWRSNSQQTLAMTIKNAGPSNLKPGDLAFTLSIPSGLTFTGSNNSNYTCSSNSALITCMGLNGLQPNSQQILELNFEVSNLGNTSLTFNAHVDHDQANSPDLFDHKSFNNDIAFNVDIRSPDLSPSTLTLADKNGGLLVAGDVITATLILDDASELDINNLNAIIDMPAFTESYTKPAGYDDIGATDPGVNGTGKLDLINISFASNNTAIVEFEIELEEDTPADTIIDLSAQLNLNANQLIINAEPLIVTDGSVPSAGNKQLYLNTSNTLSRIVPNDGEVSINPESSKNWILTPSLQSDLTFSLNDIAIESKFESNGAGFFGFIWADITYSLYDSDNNLLAQGVESQITLRPNVISSVNTTLEKNPSITSNEITLAKGKGLYLNIRNDAFQNNTGDERRIILHLLDNQDPSLKANGYSAVIINASTVINVDNIQVWSQPYTDNDNDGIDDSGANILSSSQPDTTLSIRAQVSDPFGAFDITNALVNVSKADGSNVLNNAPMSVLDDFISDTASASKTFQATLDLLEEDEISGNWSITVTSNEGVEGDVSHTRSRTFKIIPFMPNIALNKTITVINDPINGPLSGGNNPKAIPGAELRYTIHATNTGRGESDNNSIILQDEIPDNSELYIGNIICSNRGPGTGDGPICFEDGVSPNESDLAFDFISLAAANDDVFFSQDGIDFDYEPVDSGDGYDPSIRHIRIEPAGAYKKAKKDGSQTPEFNFSYQVRLK